MSTPQNQFLASCSNCGAVVDPAKPFCASCGATLGKRSFSPPPLISNPLQDLRDAQVVQQELRADAARMSRDTPRWKIWLWSNIMTVTAGCAVLFIVVVGLLIAFFLHP